MPDTATADVSATDNSTTATTTTTPILVPSTTTTPVITTPPTETLGDAGKKAIDAMKAERNEAREKARAAESELAALKAAAEGREAEHQAQLEAQKVRDEALAKANERIVSSEVKAAAKGVLNDPKDAYKFLDLSKFEVDDDGNVDEAAIAAALEQLVKDKPYLAAQGGKRFQGTADGGARNDDSKPRQLTKADLADMSPDAIVAAKAAGQLKNLISGEQ